MSATALAPGATGRWLVSRDWDLAVFGGSALVALTLLAWGAWTGALAETTPVWAWVLTVVLVDVAHVWATAYRVYADPEERRRRPGLYYGVPLAVYATGVLLYSTSPGLFWRALAYVAVFHFVRQQYGWVALYRRRLGDHSTVDRVLDDAAIYSATLYPLLYWHANCRGNSSGSSRATSSPGCRAKRRARSCPSTWGSWPPTRRVSSGSSPTGGR